MKEHTRTTMDLNSSNTASTSNNSRCSACLTIQTKDSPTIPVNIESTTYTSMNAPILRQYESSDHLLLGQDNASTHTDHLQPSTSNATPTTAKEIGKQRTGNKLSLTSIGLNLRRAKSFNFKTKRSSTATNSKKQVNSSGATTSSGGLGPIVSSLSPKWPLRFSCTARREQKQQEKANKMQQQQSVVNGVSSEGCCRCVCYKPLGILDPQSTTVNSTINSRDITTLPSSCPDNKSSIAAEEQVSSRLCATSAHVTAPPTCTAGGGANGTSRQQSSTLTNVMLDDRSQQAVGSYGGANNNNIISGGGAGSGGGSSSSSVVQLVSNAIVILEEERERNRTMAAMAMAAMNGVVTTGAGIGGIYGSNSGGGGGGCVVGEVWEPLFHIPCMSNTVGSLGSQQQQQLLGQQHEDCDESARRQRAREIEQGVDPPANYRSSLSACGGGAPVGGTRRVQLLCDNNTGGGGAADQLSMESTTRRLQIVCPSDLPVDSLRALFQDHVTLRTCPLDSSWTGCHTQVDFVHCLVPDLLSISRCTFYWGKMDRYEAERLLDGKPEGTFLLRDSAQEEFLFSVSFRKYGRSLHARIEQWNHKFSFDSHDPGVYTSDTVCGLIEHYKDPSSCMFFEPVLTWPLHRNFTFSLQHLSRAVITSRLHYDDVNQLQLPKALKSYLKEYHYRQKVRVERFDDCGPNDCGGGGSGGQAVQWLVNTNGGHL